MIAETWWCIRRQKTCSQFKYVNVYPDDDDEGVEFMCGEYADGWDALALMLEDQRDALNADVVLSKKQKKDTRRR